MNAAASLFCLPWWLFIDIMALLNGNVLLISSIDLHCFLNNLHWCLIYRVDGMKGGFVLRSIILFNFTENKTSGFDA